MGVDNLFKKKTDLQKKVGYVGPMVDDVPREFGEGEHFVQLAYITPDEAAILKELDLYGSNPPHTGPEIKNIPNYNDFGQGSMNASGSEMSAAERGDVKGSGLSASDVAGIQGGYNAAAGGQQTSQNFMDSNQNTNTTSTTPVQEEKPGFFQSVYNFFTDLAPTQEEQFAQDWDKLASWEKKKALSQLGITEEQLTGDVMSAFNDYNSMSLSEVQDAITGFGISDLFSNPFDSGTLGIGYSMVDLFNPFTDTQYNLSDPNNFDANGMYTGNVASLNSAQLADLAKKQKGGLTSTQLGQALAGAVDDAETRDATRGPENPPGGNNDVIGDEVVLTEEAKQIADLISRGFSESMAERMVSSGKYFASYD